MLRSATIRTSIRLFPVDLSSLTFTFSLYTLSFPLYLSPLPFYLFPLHFDFTLMAQPPSSTTGANSSRDAGFKLPHLRWYICSLLFMGATVNYIDRGTIAILAPQLQKLLHGRKAITAGLFFPSNFPMPS